MSISELLPPSRREAALLHARYYAAQASEAGNLYRSGNQQAALKLLDCERAQIDGGWAWAREHARDGHADALILDYANSMSDIGKLRYDIRGEWMAWLVVVLETARRQGNRRFEGAALGNLGLAYYTLGEARKAIRCHEQQLVIAREIADQQIEMIALSGLGIAYTALGEAQNAITYHTRHLEIAEAIDDPHSCATALGNLGNVYSALGNTRHAIHYFQQSLTILRDIGDQQSEALALGSLGNSYMILGDTRRAIEFFEQALRIMRVIGDLKGQGAMLNSLGIAYKNLGEVRRAIEFYEQRLVIARGIGDQQGEGNTLGNLGNAYVMLGDVRRGIEFYEQRLGVARATGDRRGEGLGLGNLGNAYTTLGELRHAVNYYEQAIVIAQKIGDRASEARHSWNLGLIYDQEGDTARAVELMLVYIAYLRELRHPDAEKAAAHVERLRQRLERRRIDIHTVIIEENKTTEKDNHADSLLESEATPKQKRYTQNKHDGTANLYFRTPPNLSEEFLKGPQVNPYNPGLPYLKTYWVTQEPCPLQERTDNNKANPSSSALAKVSLNPQNPTNISPGRKSLRKKDKVFLVGMATLLGGVVILTISYPSSNIGFVVMGIGLLVMLLSIQIKYSTPMPMLPNPNAPAHIMINPQNGWNCSVCGGFVRQDATFCKYCKAVFISTSSKKPSMKELAHEWALDWWEQARAHGRTSAICDRCAGTIAEGEGYLCKPAIVYVSGMSSSHPLFNSPDLVCDSCFDRGSYQPWKSEPPPSQKRIPI